VEVALSECEALPGDIYLLCSDGLNDMVDNADIERVLNSLKANLPLAASQLVMIATTTVAKTTFPSSWQRQERTLHRPRRSMVSSPGYSDGKTHMAKLIVSQTAK